MASLNPQAASRMRDVLQEHIDHERIPGAVALVSIGGRTDFFAALGRQDPRSAAAMAPDAIFRIYSMTKPITTLAIMMLVEECKIRLDHPVSR